MPPPPRRAMGPDRNCRQLNCPVPIAHRGGGSAEVALEAAFSYKTATGRPYSGLGLPTTKCERMLGVSTLSYKKSSEHHIMPKEQIPHLLETIEFTPRQTKSSAPSKIHHIWAYVFRITIYGYTNNRIRWFVSIIIYKHLFLRV